MDQPAPEGLPTIRPLGLLQAVSRDGRRALLQAGSLLRVADLDAGRVVTFEGPGLTLLRSAWTTDGLRFGVRLEDGRPALVSLTGEAEPLPDLTHAPTQEAVASPPSAAADEPRLALQRHGLLELWALGGDGVPEQLPIEPLRLPLGALPVIDPTGSRVAFRAEGQIVVADIALDDWRQWPEVAPHHVGETAWAPGGQALWLAGSLVDLQRGTVVPLLPTSHEGEDAPLVESVDWLSDDDLVVLRGRVVPLSGGLVYQQQLIRLSRRGESTVLFDHAEPMDPIVPTGFSAVRCLPGRGACLLSHRTQPTLFVVGLDGGAPTPLLLSEEGPQPLTIAGVRGAEGVGIRALATERVRREVPNFTAYLNQLGDVPDWFNGDWACGPASCLILAAHFGRLARWPITVQRGGAHLSDYGAYIPGFWQEGNTRFAIETQADPDGRIAKGAYAYICPPPNPAMADWGRMEQFLRLMGLEVQGQLSNIQGVDWDAVWNRLVEQVNQGHACLLSVTLRHVNTGREINHIFVAYGYVEYSDGRRAMVTKDPYGNWTQAGFGGQGGNGVHYWIPTSAQGAPASGLVRVKFIRGVWRAQPRPLGVVLDDGTGDFARYGENDPRWKFNSFYGYGNPGRALSPGAASGLWYATTQRSGPWTLWASWRFRVPQPGRYGLRAFVPSNFATTRNAQYFMAQSSDGIPPPPPMDPDMSPLEAVGVPIVQNDWNDVWRDVGQVTLQAGWVHFYLSNVTREADERQIAFDALRLDPL